MNKERLTAFTDAVLAIIMTILVLELEKPSEPTLKAIWELRTSYFSYTLSFFWLGTMWVNLHNEWHKVEKISKSVVWWSVILLFFSSWFPYTTSFVNSYFYSSTAQVFYGIIVLAVTYVNIELSKALEKANENNKKLKEKTVKRRNWLHIDILIKIAGLIISIFVYPPAMMLSVLVTSILVLTVFTRERNKK